MPTLTRLRVEWSGSAVVGPGLSTFYFETPVAGFQADVAAFFAAVKDRFPTQVSWTIPNTGEEIDAATGDIVGTWTEGAAGLDSGTSSNYWVQGVGASLALRTGSRTNNRPVTGRLFMIPLQNACWDSSGDLDASVAADFAAAGAALLAAQTGSWSVWTRPVSGAGGRASSILSVDMSTKVSTLRSRRT